MRFVSRAEIDDRRWDECILRYGGTVYNLSWYLDATAENWCALIEDDYQVIMPLPFKSKAGVKWIYQPFFTRQGGMFSAAPIDAETITSFFSHISSEFREFRYCASFEKEISLPALYNVETYIYQSLKLEGTAQQLLAGFSENARRLLRKAEKEELRCEETNNAKGVTDLFQQEKGAEIRDLRPADFDRLNRLMQRGIEEKTGKVFEVRKGDAVQASAYCWFFGDTITYLKGTATAEGRKNGAMYLLFAEIIRRYGSDYRILDFGGSRIPSIATFYRKFGAKDVSYSCFSYSRMPFFYRMLRKIGRRLQR